MRRRLVFFPALFFLVVLTGMAHKFYVSIYEVHFSKENKRIEITGRIFIDDLNHCISKASGRKTHIGEKNQSNEDTAALQKYLLSHLAISVNGNVKTIEFLRTETAENVVLCYLKVNGVSNVASLKIKNNVLTDWNTQQQNIIQADVLGIKKSLELDDDDQSGELNFKN